MNFIGYVISALGVLLLYKNDLVFGGLIFIVGGFLANKIKINARVAGIVILVLSTAYYFHNSYRTEVLFVIFFGFIMACFNSRRVQNGGACDAGWGFDIEFFSLGSSDSDGDGGGDGGGD